MIKKIIFLFIFIVGCKNPDTNVQNLQNKTREVLNSDKISNSIGEVLIPEALKIVDDWQEYKTMEKLISDYYNIAPNQALESAENLSNAAELLKDSIRIEKLNSPDIKIRLNVLYNNTLNIKSLNLLSQIDQKTLRTEISNTLESFSAVNSKINNLIKKESLEKELNNFNN